MGLIASPTNQTRLQFTSETWIYDFKSNQKTSIQLPELLKEGLSTILYIFQVYAEINGEHQLEKGESIIFDNNETVKIEIKSGTELVLFVTNESSKYYNEGMYSGKK